MSGLDRCLELKFKAAHSMVFQIFTQIWTQGCKTSASVPKMELAKICNSIDVLKFHCIVASSDARY